MLLVAVVEDLGSFFLNHVPSKMNIFIRGLLRCYTQSNYFFLLELPWTNVNLSSFIYGLDQLVIDFIRILKTKQYLVNNKIKLSKWLEIL